MPACENCGKEMRSLTLVNIDGAEMYVCPDCRKYGKPVVRKEEKKTAPKIVKPRRSVDKKDALSEGDTELDDDYPKKIQRAREGKGWSREDLGKKINEKVSIISKLEHGHIYPSDDLVRKLEKTLEIRLMVPVEKVAITHHSESSGMTLGDFIVRKNG
jgi:putative transcription factor